LKSATSFIKIVNFTLLSSSSDDSLDETVLLGREGDITNDGGDSLVEFPIEIEITTVHIEKSEEKNKVKEGEKRRESEKRRKGK